MLSRYWDHLPNVQLGSPSIIFGDYFALPPSNRSQMTANPTLFNISQIPPPRSSLGRLRSLRSPLLLPCLESCPSSNPFSILQLIHLLPPLYSKTPNVAKTSSRYSVNFIAQLTNPFRVWPLFCPSYCSLLIFSLCLTVSPRVSHHTHNLCSPARLSYLQFPKPYAFSATGP